MTQRDKIREWLRTGHRITPLVALRKFGSFRLGARIYELRGEGLNIKTDFVTRHGRTFASYRIKRFGG